MTVPSGITRVGRVSLKEDKPKIPIGPDELTRTASFEVVASGWKHVDLLACWDPSELMMARTDRAYCNFGYELAVGDGARWDWLGRHRVHGATRRRHMHSVPGWVQMGVFDLPPTGKLEVKCRQTVSVDNSPNQAPDDDLWPLMRAWGAVTVKWMAM